MTHSLLYLVTVADEDLIDAKNEFERVCNARAGDGGQSWAGPFELDELDEKLIYGLARDYFGGEQHGFGLEEAAYLAARAVLESPRARAEREKLRREVEAERRATS